MTIQWMHMILGYGIFLELALMFGIRLAAIRGR